MLLGNEAKQRTVHAERNRLILRVLVPGDSVGMNSRMRTSDASVDFQNNLLLV